jgi:hypothetical protein
MSLLLVWNDLSPSQIKTYNGEARCIRLVKLHVNPDRADSVHEQATSGELLLLCCHNSQWITFRH